MKKLIIIVLIIAGAIVAAFFIKPSNLRAPSERPFSENEVNKSADTVISNDYVKYPGEDGKTAFAVLQETVSVGFKKYDFGVFVESINSVKPDSKHFWKLYVNGQESQLGADQVQTENSDVIEWKLEEVKN